MGGKGLYWTCLGVECGTMVPFCLNLRYNPMTLDLYMSYNLIALFFLCFDEGVIS